MTARRDLLGGPLIYQPVEFPQTEARRGRSVGR